MCLATNIVRREARYYVRLRVPTDLVGALNKVEVWKALGTADATEARRLALPVLAALHGEFDEARKRLRL